MSTEEQAASPQGPARGEVRARRLSRRQEWLVLLVLTIALAAVVKTFLLQAFFIPSASMEPGLERGDRIVVEKVSSWFGQPERGDVVVFEDPGGWLGPDEQPGPQNPVARALGATGLLPTEGHLVKRVVAVAGDVVDCCDGQGRLLVNGEPLEEDGYLVPGAACAGPMTGTCRWVAGPVPVGKLFVMGDNRGASGDSTAHLCTETETDCTDDPFVEVSSVVGRVGAVVWPLDRLGTVEHDPASFDAVFDAP